MSALRRTLIPFLIATLLTGTMLWGRQQPSLPSYIIAYGRVQANEIEAAQGYFAIGLSTMIAVRPNTVAHQRMLELNGRFVEVVLRVQPDPTKGQYGR